MIDWLEMFSAHLLLLVYSGSKYIITEGAGLSGGHGEGIHHHGRRRFVWRALERKVIRVS